MGYKIDSYIERQFYDEFGGKEVWMEEIHVSGNGICDTVFIEQEGNTISLTASQAVQLREALERVR
jgi:hypothetical protein